MGDRKTARVAVGTCRRCKKKFEGTPDKGRTLFKFPCPAGCVDRDRIPIVVTARLVPGATSRGTEPDTPEEPPTKVEQPARPRIVKVSHTDDQDEQPRTGITDRDRDETPTPKPKPRPRPGEERPPVKELDERGAPVKPAARERVGGIRAAWARRRAFNIGAHNADDDVIPW